MDNPLPLLPSTVTSWGSFIGPSQYSTWPDQCSLWLQNSDSRSSKPSFFRTEPDLVLSGHAMYPVYYVPVIVRQTVAVHYLQDPCLTGIRYGNPIYNFSVPGTRIILCFYRLSISSLVYSISTFFRLFNVELSIYYQGQTSFWAIKEACTILLSLLIITWVSVIYRL